jgi:hypothetical protein
MKRLPVLFLAIAACKTAPLPQTVPVADPVPGAKPARPVDPLTPTTAEARRHDAIPRPDFNRWAVRENLPVYWTVDANNDGNLDPNEVATLLFYPTSGLPSGEWVQGGAFTRAFETAYAQIVDASKKPGDLLTEDGKRRELVGKDLDQGRATLVWNDLSELSAGDKKFVGHMMKVASLVDRIYELQNGATALAAQLPKDAASHSLFRRNRGPKCVAPATENDPLCSAIPGSPRPVFDIYPADLQKQDKFCTVIEKRKDAKTLLSPFTAVRGSGDTLTAVAYTDAYKDVMTAISAELTAAADAVTDPAEQPMVTYLRAAAASFQSNHWEPADEAWAKMTVDNSKWYVRVAPDEVYWEPCSSKAGTHLTFARINQGSRVWQQKLVPVQQEMEAAIAKAAGRPYLARTVTFHLPDFIDIVVNAGDDRDALGATIGQSLPNWGPVANEGRGRTVAMVNLYGDPDSIAARRSQAESMLDAKSLENYTGAQEPGLLSTILHEATHNLGPAHEYKVGGREVDDAFRVTCAPKTALSVPAGTGKKKPSTNRCSTVDSRDPLSGKKAGEVFGGPMASVLEELKAQTGALFLLELLRTKGIISDQLAAQSYADAIVWALGHISQGMYSGAGERKTYSNVAAIQIGFLVDRKALTWDANATAGNGTDKGALVVHPDKLVPAVAEMMKLVAGIKARGDKPAAEKLVKQYVDSSKVVPHKIISERFLRFPKASFVYSVKL